MTKESRVSVTDILEILATAFCGGVLGVLAFFLGLYILSLL